MNSETKCPKHTTGGGPCYCHAKQEVLPPCPFCGSTDLSKNLWSLNGGEVDAVECNGCYAGAPKESWIKRHKVVNEKPIFLPLNSKYYEAFHDGRKTEELRQYGPRWNEKTCQVGRAVVLSKGYGKHARLKGKVWRFFKQHGTLFGSGYQAAILDVYGTLDIEIACIGISEIEPFKTLI